MADIIEYVQRFKQGAEALNLRDTASLFSLSSILDAISTPLANDVDLRYDHSLPLHVCVLTRPLPPQSLLRLQPIDLSHPP